ncbi:hypothetical protein [Pedobacter jamesrossensis]|uniref:Lipocalin-like domain-containing protein n=1 Tax=Pedobacter jamesrossensis TaxID=1908238 RepID=A0ABV8NUK5_9SPHI
MKKLILLAITIILFGCKKKDKEADQITKQKWVLETATVTPGFNINGKLITDYKSIEGVNGCLSNNYTLTFLANGTYQISSTGLLCDMLPNSPEQRWKRSGSQIILTRKSAPEIFCNLNGNTLNYTIVNTPGVAYYSVLYSFKAQ